MKTGRTSAHDSENPMLLPARSGLNFVRESDRPLSLSRRNNDHDHIAIHNSHLC